MTVHEAIFKNIDRLLPVYTEMSKRSIFLVAFHCIVITLRSYLQTQCFGLSGDASDTYTSQFRSLSAKVLNIQGKSSYTSIRNSM